VKVARPVRRGTVAKVLIEQLGGCLPYKLTHARVLSSSDEVRQALYISSRWLLDKRRA